MQHIQPIIVRADKISNFNMTLFNLDKSIISALGQLDEVKLPPSDVCSI